MRKPTCIAALASFLTVGLPLVPAAASTAPVANPDHYVVQAGATRIPLDLLGNDTYELDPKIGLYDRPQVSSGVEIVESQNSGDNSLFVTVSPTARTRTVSLVYAFVDYDNATGDASSVSNKTTVTFDVVGGPSEATAGEISDVNLPFATKKIASNRFEYRYKKFYPQIAASTRDLDTPFMNYTHTYENNFEMSGRATWFDPKGAHFFTQDMTASSAGGMDTSTDYRGDRPIAPGQYTIAIQLFEFDGLVADEFTVTVDFLLPRKPVIVSAAAKSPVLEAKAKSPYILQKWFVDVRFPDPMVLTSIDLEDDAAAPVPKRLQKQCNASGRITDIRGDATKRRALGNGVFRYIVSGYVCNVGGRHDFKVYAEWASGQWEYDGGTLRSVGSYRVKRAR